MISAPGLVFYKNWNYNLWLLFYPVLIQSNWSTLVGGDCVLTMADDLTPALQSTLQGMAHLGLVDGQITSGMCEMSVHLGLECLIGTKPLWRTIPGWMHDTWSFQHCKQGGVTTSCMNGCCLAWGSQLPALQAMPYHLTSLRMSQCSSQSDPM
jgi:hypothetical protein